MMTQSKNFLNVLLMTAAICFTGCAGKDGDPGPAGTNGTNGTNGTDGVGFDEDVAYGNINVTFSGKRPTDSVAFSAVEDFKFFPGGNNPYYYSSVSVDSETGDKTFQIERFLEGVNEHINENYFYAYVKVDPKGTVTYYEIGANTTIITGSKYFGINEYTYTNDGSTNDSIEIKDLTYDSATGKLKFNFNWNITKSSSTQYDLSASGTVDVIALEALNSVNNGGE
ncbi:MAG TPA: hypothetical protein VIM65_24555 [Cyclobacteriaceae bacterium]